MTAPVVPPFASPEEQEFCVACACAEHWMTVLGGEEIPFPDSYTAIDLETTGTNRLTDLICTAAWCVVREGVVTELGHAILDWPGHLAGEDLTWFLSRIQSAQVQMAERGAELLHTPQYLSKYGTDPIKGLSDLLEVCRNAAEIGEVLVAHNGWDFDVEFIQAAAENVLNAPYVFHDDAFYDSGVVELACQLDPVIDRVFPVEGQTSRDWALRLRGQKHPGVRWSLQYCRERYRLGEGDPVMAEVEPHTAASDAYLLHHLVARHRQMARV